MVLELRTEEKCAYALMISRLLAYFIFFVITLVQCLYESKSHITKKKMLNTRFFTFLSMCLFCACRVVGSILYLNDKEAWGVGTLYYFFWSWGTFFVFITWAVVGALWLQLFYQFFFTKEIRTQNIKKIYFFAFSIIGIYFIWQTVISIIFLMNSSINVLEAIGMVAFLFVFFLSQFLHGFILVKRMRQSEKASNHTISYQVMINKSKILLYTIVIAVFIVIVQDLVFNFTQPPVYKNFPISTLITGIVDFTQMVIICYVLGNGSLKKYFLFKKVSNVKASHSNTDDSDKYNTSSTDKGSENKNNNNSNNNNLDIENGSNNSKVTFEISSQ